MPLFVKDGVSILYIHVPKTGGSSIEHFFLANGFRAEFLDFKPDFSFNDYRMCSPQHMHAALLLALIRPERMRYIFMTVRHPLSRIISEYKMQVRVNGEARALGPWVERQFGLYRIEKMTSDNHIRPQCEFVIPGCEVFKQEGGLGPALVLRIEQRTGLFLAHRRIGGENADDGLIIDEAEAESIRPMVEDFYRQDYEAFGY